MRRILAFVRVQRGLTYRTSVTHPQFIRLSMLTICSPGGVSK
jgi:hypothetical protein